MKTPGHAIPPPIRLRLTRAGLSILFLFIFLTFPLSACTTQKATVQVPISAQNFQLNTLITITLYDSEDQSLFPVVFDEIRRLENILSASLPGSDPDRLAQNAGKEYIAVSEETLTLLEKSNAFSDLSEGAFDCTVGPLVSLWGITDGGGRVPSEEEREYALSLIGYRNVLMNEDGWVMLKYPGMKLDFGAIAKGYIADQVKDLLAARGVRSAVIDLGGNIVLLGNKPDGSDYRIGVRDPAEESGDYFAVFEKSDMSLVSSGSYERFFVQGDQVYHHILDVHTGYPSETELLQVTILSNSSMDGDGFSTTAFLLGLERGLALLNSTEGVEGVFVTKDKQVYLTNGLDDDFTIVSDAYTLKR
ncbi:MAG: FAD:protein FMN transferase [Clostridiales bacterium]|nr:FAD:protein FMN transferase [Clostridiales bacterium]